VSEPTRLFEPGDQDVAVDQREQAIEADQVVAGLEPFNITLGRNVENEREAGTFGRYLDSFEDILANWAARFVGQPCEHRKADTGRRVSCQDLSDSDIDQGDLLDVFTLVVFRTWLY
jgi:hypothetical protein